jgi:hypothetical protein
MFHLQHIYITYEKKLPFIDIVNKSGLLMFNGSSAMKVPGGSGQLGALKLVVVLPVHCCEKGAGELWLIYEQH